MVKILIADTDVKRNSASCQFLANEKGFEIESTNDGSSTIKKYLEIEPNIFILDSNFKDIKVSVIRYKIEETSVSSMFFSVTDVLQISKKRPPPVVAHRKRSGETKPF